MTCIVGLVHDDRVWIGADSAGVTDYDLQNRGDAKVFQLGAMVIGFTSSFRMGQLLRYGLTLPERASGIDLHQYMVLDFIGSVRACLQNGGFAQKNNEQEHGGEFLVGYAGTLFYIGADYQVGIMADGYAAVGCGDRVALGALYATHRRAPRTRITVALEAAAHFSAGVRAPFLIVHS